MTGSAPECPLTNGLFSHLAGFMAARHSCTASMAAGWCVDREKFSAVGMEINANHIRPAHSGRVTATASPEALGRTTQIWSIRITDEAQKLVCISRITMAAIELVRM
ncbi:hotdog fold thioesterase [Porphyrobacter sp. MBR-155]|uniref:hotdog fold thioesterase n=1 Tax=Porphyrobacter sp. MBR-155 TaxID=3156464 RepID=UPI0033912D0B